MREYTLSKEAGSHFSKLNVIRKVSLIPLKECQLFLPLTKEYFLLAILVFVGVGVRCFFYQL